MTISLILMVRLRCSGNIRVTLGMVRYSSGSIAIPLHEVMCVREHILHAFKGRDWGAILDWEGPILEAGEPGELRALAEAYLYTTSYLDAARLFRRVRPLVQGRALAATLVNGAVALYRIGDYPTALSWVRDYFSGDPRPWDGAAYEVEANVLWRMGRPHEQVDSAFEAAVTAFGDDSLRIQRLLIDRAEACTCHGQLDRAEAILNAITLRDLKAYVLGGRARIAAARGDRSEAYRLALTAIRLLYTTVDQFGSILEEIADLHILLSTISEGEEGAWYLAAAQAAAVQLQCPPLMHKVQSVRKEAKV